MTALSTNLTVSPDHPAMLTRASCASGVMTSVIEKPHTPATIGIGMTGDVLLGPSDKPRLHDVGPVAVPWKSYSTATFAATSAFNGDATMMLLCVMASISMASF